MQPLRPDKTSEKEIAASNNNTGAEVQTQPERWLSLAIEGDVDAFGELYRLYARSIFGYCFHRIPNHAEAEDLTAQVFLKAWEAMPRYQLTKAPFEAWLFRIAHNLVANHHRKRQRHGEVADAGLEPHVLESFTEEVSVGAGKDFSNPVERLFTLADYTALYSALEKLTEEQRQVIYLRFVKNVGHSQIATLLGKKEGTIRGIQFRATQALEKILAKEGFLFDE